MNIPSMSDLLRLEMKNGRKILSEIVYKCVNQSGDFEQTVKVICN